METVYPSSHQERNSTPYLALNPWAREHIAEVHETAQSAGRSPVFSCVLVTERQKNSLLELSTRIPSRKRINEVILLLTRLKEFKTGLADSFYLKPWTTSNVTFRLIQEYQPHNPMKVDNALPSYIAVSYCWHNESWNPAPGLHQFHDKGLGIFWPVSELVMKTITQMRCSVEEGIWIDAICIEQEDENEKKTAIALMDIIYGCARKVIVVLEDVILTEEEETMLKQQGITETLTDEISTAITITPQSPHQYSRLLTKLFSARYFDRAWCLHEYQLTANSLILIPTVKGILSIKPSILQKVHVLAKPHFLSCPECSYLALECNYPVHYNRFSSPMLRDRWENRVSASEIEPFYSAFRDTMQLSSSVITDKVTIALRTAQLGVG
jgi:Heterokaryon incompatibility protein (HET)